MLRADAAAWRSSVDDTTFEAFAKAALVAVNRTESGGAALDAVVATVAGEDGSKLLVPVPDSRRAEPLRVHLDLGPYACDDGWRWGIRARVEGTTFYRLFAPDDFDEKRLRCTARYANALLLPLDGLGAEAVLRDASRASVGVALEPPQRDGAVDRELRIAGRQRLRAGEQSFRLGCIAAAQRQRAGIVMEIGVVRPLGQSLGQDRPGSRRIARAFGGDRTLVPFARGRRVHLSRSHPVIA